MVSRLRVTATAKTDDGLRAEKGGSVPEEMGSTILGLSNAPATGKRKVSSVPQQHVVAAATDS
jgi:hypothetical protein